MDRIIVIVGPTASGKTGLSVALARHFGGEVISADSMQLYRGMDVGTAKVTAEEMQGVPHHMIDVADPGEAFSAGRFVQEADPILRDILSRGKTAVIAGGTGLYVDSLIQGRDFVNPDDIQRVYSAVMEHRVFAKDGNASTVKSILESIRTQVKIPK